MPALSSASASPFSNLGSKLVKLKNGKTVRVPQIQNVAGDRIERPNLTAMSEWRGWILKAGEKIAMPSNVLAKWERFKKCNVAWRGEQMKEGLSEDEIVSSGSACRWFLCPHCHLVLRGKRVDQYGKRLERASGAGPLHMLTIKAPELRLRQNTPSQYIVEAVNELRSALTAVFGQLHRHSVWCHYVFGLHAHLVPSTGRILFHYHVVGRGGLPDKVQEVVRVTCRQLGYTVRISGPRDGSARNVANYITNRINGMFIQSKEKASARNRDRMAFSRAADNLHVIIQLESALHNFRWSGKSRLPKLLAQIE